MEKDGFRFPVDVPGGDVAMLFTQMVQSLERVFHISISIHDRMGLLADRAGHYILPDRAVHMHPYCLYRRFEEKGWSRRCVAHCKYHVNHVMRRKEHSEVFNCWKGVSELVVPLIKDNQHVMSIYAGAFRGELEPDNDLPPELLEMHRELPPLTPEYRLELEKVLYMLGSAILYIVEESGHPSQSAIVGRKSLIEQAIERSAHNPDFSLNDLALKLNLSPSRASHLVRELFQESFSRLILRVRINRARQMLANTDMSLKEISDSLGFASVYYFSRVFRSSEGFPPGRYRKDSRPEPEEPRK